MCFKYKFKYISNRQVNISGIDPALIDDAFRVLQEQLDINWLDTNNGNRVQRLWKEPYHLATVELYSLGDALKRLLEVDPKFVKSKIAEIKSNDERAQNGAFFELFALNAIAAHHTVLPAKEHNPGYDGTILLSEQKKVRLSLKNFSLSVHHLSFLKEAEIIKNGIENYLKQFNAKPVEIFITKKSGYPSKADWNLLADHLPNILVGVNTIPDGRIATGNVGDWGIIQRPLVIPDKKFASSPNSYTCIISSPFHKNEEKNLHDKIEEACANLAEHATIETEHEKNLVMVHLPRAASRKNCEQWSRDYLDLYPDKPISGILLYQPLIITNDSKKTTYLSNGFSAILRPSLVRHLKDYRIKLQFPVGKLEEPFGEHVIFIQDKPDSAIKIELTNCYVYQHGNHYFEATKTKEGLKGQINKVASGVFTHSVMTIGTEKIVVSGRFEPVDILEIL